MSGRALLDTNIVIVLFAKDGAVLRQLPDVDEVFVSSITLGELYFGAQKSSRTRENTARIDEFAESSAVLFCDAEAARRYGAIKSQLKLEGMPIPENDIWIAAVATQHQLTLVTRDSHFEAVRGLQVTRW